MLFYILLAPSGGKCQIQDVVNHEGFGPERRLDLLQLFLIAKAIRSRCEFLTTSSIRHIRGYYIPQSSSVQLEMCYLTSAHAKRYSTTISKTPILVFSLRGCQHHYYLLKCGMFMKRGIKPNFKIIHNFSNVNTRKRIFSVDDDFFMR